MPAQLAAVGALSIHLLSLRLQSPRQSPSPMSARARLQSPVAAQLPLRLIPKRHRRLKPNRRPILRHATSDWPRLRRCRPPPKRVRLLLVRHRPPTPRRLASHPSSSRQARAGPSVSVRGRLFPALRVPVLSRLELRSSLRVRWHRPLPARVRDSPALAGTTALAPARTEAAAVERRESADPWIRKRCRRASRRR